MLLTNTLKLIGIADITLISEWIKSDKIISFRNQIQ
jgi:hypothetical protein